MKTFFLFPLVNILILATSFTQDITFDFDPADPSVKVGHTLGAEPVKVITQLKVTVTDIDPSTDLNIVFKNNGNKIKEIRKTDIAAQFAGGNIPNTISFSFSGKSVAPYGVVLDKKPFTIHVENGSVELHSIAFTSDGISSTSPSVVTAEGKNKNETNDKFYKNTNNTMEPFKDAVSLGYFLNEKQDELMILDIMHDYFKVDSAKFTLKTMMDSLSSVLNAALLKKPFEVMNAKSFGSTIGAETDDASGQSSAKGSPSSILTSPTILIDALAQLIAKRFKEELSIAYIRDFKKWLNENHVDKLLPHTSRVITFQEPVNYKTFLPLVRAALHEDYMDAPDNLYTFAGQEAIKNMIKGKNANVYTGLMGGLYVLKRRADLPADILEGAVDEDFIKTGDEELREYLTFLKAVSINLRADDSYTGWVKSGEMQKLLLGNRDNLRIFAGLLFLKEGRNRGANQMGLLVDNRVLKSLREDKSENVDRFFKVYRSIQDVQANVESVDFQKIVTLDQDVKVQAQIQRARQLQKVLSSTLVLGKEIGTLHENQYKKLTAILDEIMVTIESAYSKEYGGIVNGILSIMDEVGIGIDEEFTKYATFTVNLLNAQNSNDALLVLETVAMPVGGYRVKRKATISASVTSYPGLFGAREIFRGTDFEIAEEALADNGDEVDARHFSWGFTAPVGVSLDFGINTTGAKNLKGEEVNVDIPGSFSLFVSLIDIGSVVSFRLQDNVSTLPELKWSNVVAPGLYASFGFRNTPLTAIFGYQYGPNLREISTIETEADGIKTEATYDASAHRWGASFVVDIALLNIFAKGR